MSDQQVPTLRRLLEESGLTADPALDPVIDLVVRIQSERQRPIWATRSGALYALARLHPEIHAAVFGSSEAWDRFVSELGLERFDPPAKGDGAEAGPASGEAPPGTGRSPRRSRRGRPK